jgi:hypothetical protein
MKIALLNLSNNISDFKTTPSGETIYIKKMLELCDYNVDIITEKRSKYTISFEDITNIQDYDKLLVVNGAVNFFGGKQNMTIINNYILMAKYDKTIFYLLTDIRLPFKQLWPSIKNRKWDYTINDVYVDESKIKVISQTYNLDVVKQFMPNLDILYFPLERYKLLFNQLIQPRIKTIDLIYGGSFRAGQREKKMIEYLFDTDYTVEFFGTAREEQFKRLYTKAPVFTPKINFEDVISKNGEGYASIIIGDNLYNGNHITLRVWEVLLSDAIILIDDDFDPYHKIMLQDWFYVKNKQDVKSKIFEIKNNEKVRQYLLDFQKNRLDKLFNKEDYLNELRKIINEN